MQIRWRRISGLKIPCLLLPSIGLRIIVTTYDQQLVLRFRHYCNLSKFLFLETKQNTTAKTDAHQPKIKKKTPLKRNLKSNEKTSYKEFNFWVVNTDPLSSTKNPFKHKPSPVLLNNIVVELLLIELNNLVAFNGRFREEWFILFIFIFCSFVTQWCILSILIELEQVFEMFQWKILSSFARFQYFVLTYKTPISFSLLFK